MATAAPEARPSRREAVAAKLREHRGACRACKCERFEHNAHMDGFPTCACTHTQWSHKAPNFGTAV